MKLYQKVARRYIEASKLERFKEEAKWASYSYKLNNLAESMLGPPIGEGSEAKVYDAGSDKILKISSSAKNLRAEYVIFVDPQYQQVTPEAYDHGENWKWIVVEKVEPLGRDNWPELAKHLPHLKEKMEKRGKGFTYGGLWSVLLDIGKGNLSWLKDLPQDEKTFVLQVIDLHEKLGLQSQDIRPENIGIDKDGNLVLIDIYTEGA